MRILGARYAHRQGTRGDTDRVHMGKIRTIWISAARKRTGRYMGGVRSKALAYGQNAQLHI
jgi:hypothetical protein